MRDRDKPNTSDKRAGGSAEFAPSKGRTSTGNSRGAIKLEDVIVVLFALLGFGGCVWLYNTNAAPIITSFFLATGVASLVYRFLGGIQGAAFKWGALKLGGTMAALVGVAFGVNYYLQTQTRIPTAGEYEWQWAGDGWRGYVDVESNGAADIDMKQFMTCNGVRTENPILRMTAKGKAEGTMNGRELRVSFPVQFIKYDGCKAVGLEAETTVLAGTLHQTAAYVGRISYTSKHGSPTGDMILVKYYSH